ncbi:MAG: hypothetical protein APR55_06945 [Methanolinea sp. SDB]|nr:MAG: hypothetical protein APR55_06945 [Methanolinea sp. SDB]
MCEDTGYFFLYCAFSAIPNTFSAEYPSESIPLRSPKDQENACIAMVYSKVSSDYTENLEISEKYICLEFRFLSG